MQENLVQKVVDHAKDVASDKIDTQETLISESMVSKVQGVKSKPMEPAPTMPKELNQPTEAAPAPPSEHAMSPPQDPAPIAPEITDEKVLPSPVSATPKLSVAEIPTKKSPPPIPQKPTTSKSPSVSSTTSTETSPNVTEKTLELTKDDLQMESPKMTAPKMPEGPPKAIVKTDNEPIEAKAAVEPKTLPSKESKEVEAPVMAPPQMPVVVAKIPQSEQVEQKSEIVRPDIERSKVEETIKNTDVDKIKTMSDLTGKRLSEIKGKDRDFDPVISELAKKLDIAMKGTFGSPDTTDSHHTLTQEEIKEEEIEDSKPLMMAKKPEMPVSAPPQQSEVKKEEHNIQKPKEIVQPAPQVVAASIQDAKPKVFNHPNPDSPTMEKKKKSFFARLFSFC